MGGLQVDLNAMGRQPRAFVFAATNWGDASPAASTHALRGAELGYRHLDPLDARRERCGLPHLRTRLVGRPRRRGWSLARPRQGCWA